MNKRVLVVEDDKRACRSLTKLLELKEIRVTCAETFGEALTCVQVSQFDLVVVDLGLPDSEPLQTLERVHELHSSRAIVFTGVDEPAIIRECMRRNVRFILKGTSATKTLEAILVEMEWLEPSEELEEAIIDTHRTQVQSTTNGAKIRRWIAANAVALLIAGFVAIDHWGGFMGGVRGSVLSDAALRQQVLDNTRGIREEREARNKSEEWQAKINQSVLDELKGIHVELGTLHAENERSKAERTDLFTQVAGIRQTTDAIYKYLLDHKSGN